ncbi:MAG: PD40 domain-containing protein [Anaerolineales bacterium]|nr:PD40 domain-containing protein [Anaerolineales bacterium]
MQPTARPLRMIGMLGLIPFALGCTLFSPGAGGTAQPWKTEVKETPGGGSETGAVPTVEPAAGEFRKLADMGRIVFSSIRENGLSDIYMMNADGSDVHFLEFDGSTDLAPAWSPDGEWIAFLSSGTRNTFDILRMRPGGTDIENLTDSTSDESGFDWSPDGTQIVFSSNRSGNYELYTMYADGSNVKQMTQTAELDEAEPAWSPDGAALGCLCGPVGEYTGDICLVKADGSGGANLTPDDPDIDDFIWSPDGKRIAFGMPLYPEEIWIMDSEGRGKENLSNDPADDGGIAFSPDGTMIVFSSDRNGKSKQIYLLHLANNSVTALTDNEMVNVSPAWSPDGKWVVFIQTESLGVFDFELYAVRIDGKGLTNLTNNPGKDYGADWGPM